MPLGQGAVRSQGVNLLAPPPPPRLTTRQEGLWTLTTHPPAPGLLLSRGGEGGRGFWTQNLVYQKWPDQIFPIVNFVFPHYGHFGLGRGGGGFGGGVPQNPPWFLIILKKPCPAPPRPSVISDLRARRSPGPYVTALTKSPVEWNAISSAVHFRAEVRGWDWQTSRRSIRGCWQIPCPPPPPPREHR